MLFKKKDLTDIELHVVGATVRHSNPFEELEVPVNQEELTEEFIDEWVMPFYRVNLAYAGKEFMEGIVALHPKITPDQVIKLLGDFNWRTRITGAYFSAIKHYTQLEDILGNQLLKSEVCYAGTGYCLALATFATPKSVGYLKQYLEYYLTQKDLWFDQGDAMAALAWIDKQQNTHEMESYLNKWNSFIENKANWNLESSITNFESQMAMLKLIKEIING